MQWLLALLMSNLTLSKVKIQQLLLQMTIIVNKDRTFQIWVNYLKTKPQTYFFTLCYAILRNIFPPRSEKNYIPL